MPIRSIKTEKYKGISELYRASDGEVTGYYVTYRDAEGKPVKHRVEANSRDEALERLNAIKSGIDQKKQGQDVSTKPEKKSRNIRDATPQKKPPAKQASTPNALQAYQKKISSFSEPASVALVDIIAFDDINILYGYEIGSRVIDMLKKVISQTLDSHNREEIFKPYGIAVIDYELFHLYADKICIFFKNDFSHHLLNRIVNDLLTKISSYEFPISEADHIQINVTIGATKSDCSASLLYAEKALQEAKKLQTGYIYYDSHSLLQNEHIVNQVYNTILDNIRNDSVVPFFQCIFDSSESSVPYKFESLMRLVDGKGRIVSPAVFMEKSKEYRLYTQLMSLMIDKVFDVLERYDVAVTLNLSYIDFNNRQLSEKLLSEIRRSQVGSRLTIEIVESEQIKDLAMVNEFIFTLRKNGVMIAIDDFGSGFANFDNILNLEADFVKLDGSLVSKIHDPKYRIILENMVKICQELGIKTIAEYIKDAEIMQLAKSIGVDYLQGYHLHKPDRWQGVVNTFNMKGAEDAAE